MKRTTLFILITAAALFLNPAITRAQMSDAAVISYIMEGITAGKTESQIGAELLSKGVSTSQASRLLKSYKSGDLKIGDVPQPSNKLTTSARKRDRASADGTYYDTPAASDSASQPNYVRNAGLSQESGTGDSRTLPVFGQDLFSTPGLSFEPNENAATPQDYVLGPGDGLLIDIWGMNEATIEQTISPEGNIIISQVGPISLSGLTIKEATSKVKSALRSKYSGFDSASSNLSITLSKIRTIRVNVLGEVSKPGSYRLSAFTNVFNALYRAGGVTPIGSLRSIRVIRDGEPLCTVDAYDFLFDGSLKQNVALREGDVVIVPPYEALVQIRGGVKRPMRYEMAPGETVADLLAFCGGFSGQGYEDELNVERQDGTQNSMHTVAKSDYGHFVLRDADKVEVMSTARDIYSNMVEVRGAVYHPGKFELGDDISTLRQLVAHAGGYLDEAFLERAQLLREKPDRTLEILSVSLKAIADGSAEDVVLHRNDILIVGTVHEMQKNGDLSITGYVDRPGLYEYAEHTTVEDLIMLAGGLNEGASNVRVEVSRRIMDPSSVSTPDTLALVYTYDMKDGLALEGAERFELQPSDYVVVRRSPAYVEQKVVTVSGEVTFPGQYVLVTNDERLSDLLKRAGGITPSADLRGGMLRRKINQYERNVHSSMARVAVQNMGKDSLGKKKLMIDETRVVGVEMDKALANPGSDYDVKLRDGDEIIIPVVSNTVQVLGDVQYPNTLTFVSGKTYRYYVRQAGGFSSSAKRTQAYVVYQNGTVQPVGRARIERGCEIVVPTKPEGRKLSVGEWLSIGTSAASVATMVATILNLTK